MNVAVEKVGVKEGKERFVLVNPKTGDIVTKKDVSEATMRKYLLSTGETEKLIDECFRKARSRYDKAHAAAEDQGDLDEIFVEVDLEDETEDV